MSQFTEKEKQRIIEEEELRASVRKKHEQKSSGLATVFSTVCPGMGQVYNGQLGKGTVFFLVALVSLILLVLGIVGLVRGATGVGTPGFLAEEEALEMTEEGLVIGAEEYLDSPSGIPLPMRDIVLVIVGLLGLGFARDFSVRDALKNARRLNEAGSGG